MKSVERSQNIAKKQYDCNIRCSRLELEDFVLVRQKTFKGKLKSSDTWKNTHYHVIQHIGRYLPVYKVKLIGETTKFRILYRNMLFPLTMRNGSDAKKQIMEDKTLKLTDTEEEIDTSSVEHVDESFMEENYKGPITRSKMKMEN